MKFIQLCMVVGLVVSGTVYCDAGIERQNKETEQLWKSLEELKQLKNKIETSIRNKECTIDEHKDRLHNITIKINAIEDKLGLQEKDWKNKAYQVGKITLGSTLLVGGAILTGGTSAVVTAALFKSGVAVTTTFQCGGIVGGLVSVKQIGTSLYETGSVDFKKITVPTLTQAATLGGILGAGTVNQTESIPSNNIVDSKIVSQLKASSISQVKTAYTA